MGVQLTPRGNPLNIKENFAAPVDGITVPITAKAEKVSAQKISASTPSVSLPTAPSVPSTPSVETQTIPTVPSISTSSIASGAVIGVAITDSVAGGVAGAVVGGLSDCLPEMPSFADDIASLEATLSGIIPKIGKIPGVAGLESLGDSIGDAIGVVSDEISGIIGGAESAINGFLDGIKLPELPKLPDINESLGLENIPCPGTVDANREETRAKADAAIAKAKARRDARKARNDEINAGWLEVAANYDAQGIPYKMKNFGPYKVPQSTMEKIELIDWGIMPKNEEEYKVVRCRIITPMVNLSKKYPEVLNWKC